MGGGHAGHPGAQFRIRLDLGRIGLTAARLAGSGIAIGLQGKGTALIHRRDLAPLARVLPVELADLCWSPYAATGAQLRSSSFMGDLIYHIPTASPWSFYGGGEEDASERDQVLRVDPFVDLQHIVGDAEQRKEKTPPALRAYSVLHNSRRSVQ